jgi:hypothetical protein
MERKRRQAQIDKGQQQELIKKQREKRWSKTDVENMNLLLIEAKKILLFS